MSQNKGLTCNSGLCFDCRWCKLSGLFRIEKFNQAVIKTEARKPCCRKETARCRSCSFRFL